MASPYDPGDPPDDGKLHGRPMITRARVTRRARDLLAVNEAQMRREMRRLAGLSLTRLRQIVEHSPDDRMVLVATKMILEYAYGSPYGMTAPGMAEQPKLRILVEGGLPAEPRAEIEGEVVE